MKCLMALIPAKFHETYLQDSVVFLYAGYRFNPCRVCIE
jgi:hypothetical protein